ncbi:sensor histidine kinase [Streptomyces sp. S3(2020)]|uniref:sensor histidine kinase n=1 Tax=Streptomyces sp. S3(2020) TaxID=2732044 RepID=UPI00148A06E2|nr:sensor histidine kinase [Streptomyces sp. S3(2020)]NNN36601.1 sensor histidine kinase [Streptomyces sp. S3(2020)]
MKSASPRGCLRGAVVGALLALCLVDVLAAYDTGYSAWRPAAVLAVGLTALLWPAARQPGWLTPQLRTAVPALASLLHTASALVLHRVAPFGPGEVAVLLCLLFVAVRNCPPRWAVVCGLLDLAAVLTQPARYYRELTTGEAPGYVLVGLVLAGLVASLAAYLRALDYRRTVAVDETRREERLAIAADLHDFVAHHVTGILVQTQMARMMATTQPEDLDPVLAGIEGAATEALASMRRTVGVLRDADGTDRRPVGDLAGIEELAERFASPVQKVALDRGGVPDDLPHEVQAAAFRVVQEALTNVRRHAADASEVSVRLALDGDRLTVSVADDGRGGTQLPDAAHGGGFGLVGLKERVTALGGELTAGPRAGYGWEIRAAFPLPAR